MKTPQRPLADNAAGSSNSPTPEASSPPPNSPPPYGDEWLTKIILKSNADMKAEQARTGKPTPVPQIRY